MNRDQEEAKKLIMRMSRRRTHKAEGIVSERKTYLTFYGKVRSSWSLSEWCGMKGRVVGRR